MQDFMMLQRGKLTRSFCVDKAALFRISGVLLACSLLFSSTAPGATQASPESPWVLQWHDEFSGTVGQKVDSSKWTSDTGAWPYNEEREYYTNATNPNAPGYTTRNAHLDGHGNLVIQALAQPFSGRQYTSARLTTVNSFSHAYGWFEA